MDKSLYTLDFMRHTYENFPIGVFVYGDDEQEKLSIRTPECWLYAIVKMKEDSVN